MVVDKSDNKMGQPEVTEIKRSRMERFFSKVTCARNVFSVPRTRHPFLGPERKNADLSGNHSRMGAATLWASNLEAHLREGSLPIQSPPSVDPRGFFHGGTLTQHGPLGNQCKHISKHRFLAQGLSLTRVFDCGCGVLVCGSCNGFPPKPDPGSGFHVSRQSRGQKIATKGYTPRFPIVVAWG